MSSTTCTLQGDTSGGQRGGAILVGDPNYGNYTVLPGVTTHSNHILSDQITYGVTDSCDVSTSTSYRAWRLSPVPWTPVRRSARWSSVTV